MNILIVLVSFLILVMAGCGFGYAYVRRMYREQKNYERGLKMVPLLIHLPPPSDDTHAEGRDKRDIVDENISRAEVLYNILASTFQKGFKSKFYGQRHLGFEIMAHKGSVHFYAAVPVTLVDVVKQAVVSAYPTANLEEVAEHNIFSPVGRITGTMGGELVLKEHYSYPIATYQDLKRDSMQAVLNSLSTLDQDDGAGIQILLRPADDKWRRTSVSEASKKRGGGKGSPKGIEGSFWWISQVFGALAKPPENKSDKKESDADHKTSSLDESISQAIEDKTKHPGYEVMIRVVASSNVAQKAQTILNNVVANFALYDAPGKNGFKFVPARDIDSFVTAYILRFFPQGTVKNLLNSVELATLFHFPDASGISTSQLQRQSSKQVDGPRNISEEGLLLGYNVFRGAKKAIRLAYADRQRHMYVVGQTGTGKSTFLENLALQDMLEGRGFAFVDPHGDTAEKLLAMVPKERTEDVIYFSPGDMEYPMGLNMFEYHSEDQKDFLIQEAINMLEKLYDPNNQGIIGPRYHHLFRNAALTIMADPNGGSLIDMPKLFRDPQFVEQKLKYVTDPTVLEFWRKEMPSAQRSSEFGDVVSWFVSKFGAFLSNEMMRNIIGQNRSSFNLRNIMDDGKILLVNLSRGRTGDLNSKLLGMIFVMKFQAAAMSRADIPEEYRRDFCLYVDEFQNFSTDSFADILSQARKFRLNLIVANQFTTQLSDDIRDAVFGNVGTVVCYRVGTNDAEFLAKQLAPVFDIDDLQFIPNYNTVTRMMIGGVPVQPFSMMALPPLGNPNTQLADALKQLSAAKYGRPKAEVSAEIFKRLETIPSKPSPASNLVGRPSGVGSFGALPTATGSTALPPAKGGASSASANPPKPQSFLDEWLSKRKASLPSALPPTVASRPGPAAGNPTPTSSTSSPKQQPGKQSSDDLDLAKPISGDESAPKPVDSSHHQGEFKINRDDSGEEDDPGIQTVHIDQSGNLSY
jgi:hypothetical protein